MPRASSSSLSGYVLAVACAASVLASGEAGGLVDAREPELPLRATTGGEVLLDVEVAPDGRVTGSSALRTTPPFTEAVLAAVRDWRFEALPDEGLDEPSPEPEPVLVVGLFRAPSFFTGTGAGTPPVDLASSEAVVAPVHMEIPPYPPNATGDGVVIAEIRVGPDGGVSSLELHSATRGFDGAALDALRAWRFRPPGDTTATRKRPHAVVIVGFRQPVLAPLD